MGEWTVIAAAGLVGAGLAGAGPAAAQKTFERPTTDTGPVDVRLVDPIEARLLPPSTVGAMQAGLWSVAIEGRPDVAIPAPAFLRARETYRVRWADGDGEIYRLIEVTGDGWVRGELVGARPRLERWLNPARAISIERAGR
jgi:hypothetical protein